VDQLRERSDIDRFSVKEADELNSFSKLGGVFDSLVKEKGVYDAATCVVGLLFQ